MQASNEQPLKRLELIRRELVLDQPFFGALLVRLTLNEVMQGPPMVVDGKSIQFNGSKINALANIELKALLAKTVLHCIAGHPWRRRGREIAKWQKACAIVANLLVKEDGFTLPSSEIIEPRFHGQAAERVYNTLETEEENEANNAKSKASATTEESQNEEGSPDPEGSSESGQESGDNQGPAVVVVDGNPAEGAGAEADWQQSAIGMSMAAGLENGATLRMLGTASVGRIPVAESLLDFVQQAYANLNYDWQQPDVRFIAHGLYLPGMVAQPEMPPLYFVVDVSGSIEEGTLNKMGQVLTTVAEVVQPERITVVYVDTEIRKVEVFDRGESVKLSGAEGGGGTKFDTIFNEADDECACAVVLSDLDVRVWPKPPAFPVLWLATGHLSEVPFGTVLPMIE